MKYKVLKPFRYAVDCRTTLALAKGAVAEIDADVAPGLIEEGFIAKGKAQAEPTSAESAEQA